MKPSDLTGPGKQFLRWPIPFNPFNPSEAGVATPSTCEGINEKLSTNPWPQCPAMLYLALQPA